jgi:branched-chain amino acid transport system substrate-binding protein
VSRRTVAALLASATLLAPAGLAPAGCSGASAVPKTVAAGRCTARVAYFGPLSGRSADLGQYIRDGVRLAVDEYNQQHRDCQVRIADFDSQGDPKQAPTLAQQIVADPQIVGVIGPAFSGEAEAADPLLDQGGVASITASATETELSARGWRTFHRIIGNDAKQGPAAGRYIRGVLHATKVFVVDDSEPYGHGLATEVIQVLGSGVVQSAKVLVGQLNFAGLVAQIKAARPDAIFFGGYYDQAGALLAQVRKAGVPAAFVSGDAVRDEGFLRQAGRAAAEGAVMTCACQPPGRATAFAQRYEAVFHRAPGTYSAEGYDATTVFLQGIQAGQLTRSAMTAYVSAYNGRGVTGTIRFTATGELVDSSVTVWAYRVRDGAIVADRPIPNS